MKRFCNNVNAKKPGILSVKLFPNLCTYCYSNLRTYQTPKNTKTNLILTYSFNY